MAEAAADSVSRDSVSHVEGLSDIDFTKYLMNEDTACPICYRPYLPQGHELKPGEGYVKPVVLRCNHGVCEECAAKCYEPFVRFVRHGVRCPFHKRDQLGNPPYYCQFVSDMTVDELKAQRAKFEAQLKELQAKDTSDEQLQKKIRLMKMEVQMQDENMIISRVLRNTGALLGSSNPRFNKEEYDKIKPLTKEDLERIKSDPRAVQELYETRIESMKKFSETAEFFYWFKFCRGCQKQSTIICKKCKLPFCEECWRIHVKDYEHDAEKDKMSIADYERETIQQSDPVCGLHVCSSCNKRAFKYCGICNKFYCRNRKCFDPCMDPDHLLVDFDPSVIELKRFEATAMDNSRKMFVHDMHDYMEPNPFLWQGSDMEGLHRTVWYHACLRKEEEDKAKKPSGTTEEDGEEVLP